MICPSCHVYVEFAAYHEIRMAVYNTDEDVNKGNWHALRKFIEPCCPVCHESLYDSVPLVEDKHGE